MRWSLLPRQGENEEVNENELARLAVARHGKKHDSCDKIDEPGNESSARQAEDKAPASWYMRKAWLVHARGAGNAVASDNFHGALWSTKGCTTTKRCGSSCEDGKPKGNVADVASKLPVAVVWTWGGHTKHGSRENGE